MKIETLAIHSASLTVYLRDAEEVMPMAQARPLVLVVPGGGYSHVSPREGDPVAVRFLAAGYHAAVLRYSVGEQAQNYLPLKQIDGALAAQRPNALILSYPVVTAGPFAHRGSFEALSGSADLASHLAFGLEDKVGPDTPPVFLWHTMDDNTVPVENSLLLLSALRRAGVPCEAHLFPHGVHGLSVCTAEVNTPQPHAAHWFALAAEWLGEVFDWKLGIA